MLYSHHDHQKDSLAHKHTLKTHNLLQAFLLQTDDIQVEVRPQAVGSVESDSPGQAVPVGLQREEGRRSAASGVFKE